MRRGIGLGGYPVGASGLAGGAWGSAPGRADWRHSRAAGVESAGRGFRILALLFVVLLFSGGGGMALAGEGMLAPGPIRALEDPGGTLGWAEVRARPPDDWRTLPEPALSPGHSDSVWWMRLTLDNADGARPRQFLELAWPMLDWLEVWILADGQVLTPLETGDRRPFASRPLDTRTFVIPVDIPPGERREVLLRLAMANGLFAPVPVRLWTPDRFWYSVQRGNLWAGLYFGALLALMSYNLLLFLATRDRNFLRYGLYLGLLTLWGLGFLGHGFQMLWPDGVWWQNQAYLSRAAATTLAASLFVMSFLETRRRMPRMHGLLLILSALVFATMAVELIGWSGLRTPMAEALRAYVALASLLFLAYLAAGLRALRLRVPGAKYFVLAWSFPVLGILIFAVQDLADLVRRSPAADYSFEIGTLLECLLLALALGKRYQRLRDDKLALERHLETEREARETQRAFLATVSHELRTPLAVIDMTLRNLVRSAAETADERTRRRHERLLDATRQLSSLLNVRLGDDRLALDLQAPRRRICDPAALLSDAAESARLMARGHLLRVDAPRGPPLVCDPDLTRLALRGLADNAVKYTPPGTEVALRCRYAPDRVWLEVQDRGPGLDEREALKVFEPGVRGTGGGQVPGTGMGLALARRLIECQGGTLTLDTAPGKGCAFRIALPAGGSDPVEVGAEAVAESVHGSQG